MELKARRQKTKFHKIFLRYLICFSFAMTATGVRAEVGLNRGEKCEVIFSDTTDLNSVKIPSQKPPISEFLKSAAFKELIQNISTHWPSDRPRILAAKFENKNASRYAAAGAFTLFLLLWPAISYSQQSLFNAPSIEPTEKHKFFFQEQVNLLPKEGSFNTTLDYGLGDGWSVGMSLFNIKAYTAETNYMDPDMLVNVEKSIQVRPHWKIGVGTQSGYNIGNNPQGFSQFKSISYLQNMFVLPKDAGKVYVGYYHANAGFTGEQSADGAMVGVEVPIIKDKLTFMADYLSGTSPISVGVIGLVWKTESQWQISAGVQVPSPGSDNDYGVVLEFTKPTL
ncbi:MAG: hypothetical protein ACXWRA_12855 [Pseudobdellovibrionaceae bacterium]